MTEPRELSYLVPVDALAEVNTAVTVLETYGPAVTQALRQLDRATTVAWKAVNLAEVTDDEWPGSQHSMAQVAVPGKASPGPQGRNPSDVEAGPDGSGQRPAGWTERQRSLVRGPG